MVGMLNGSFKWKQFVSIFCQWCKNRHDGNNCTRLLNNNYTTTNLNSIEEFLCINLTCCLLVILNLTKCVNFVVNDNFWRLMSISKWLWIMTFCLVPWYVFSVTESSTFYLNVNKMSLDVQYLFLSFQCFGLLSYLNAIFIQWGK